jgi:hypothetical protein
MTVFTGRLLCGDRGEASHTCSHTQIRSIDSENIKYLARNLIRAYEVIPYSCFKAVIVVPSVSIDNHNTIIIMEQPMVRHCPRPLYPPCHFIESSLWKSSSSSCNYVCHTKKTLHCIYFEEWSTSNAKVFLQWSVDIVRETIQSAHEFIYARTVDHCSRTTGLPHPLLPAVFLLHIFTSC